MNHRSFQLVWTPAWTLAAILFLHDAVSAQELIPGSQSGQSVQDSGLIHVQWETPQRVSSEEILFDFTQPQRPELATRTVFGNQGLELLPTATNGFFISQKTRVPLESPEPFLAIGSVWRADTFGGARIVMNLRASVDGETWGDWQEVKADEHLVSPSGEVFGNITFVDKTSKYVQFRIALERPSVEASVRVTDLRLVFINPGATPKKVLQEIEQNYQPSKESPPESQRQFPKPPVVSRTSWGCPDGQSSPQWPPEYTLVTHLIVHHTVNSNTPSDWPAVVRSIWTYHTITRRWGDIGYNYLIDSNGVVYEGRAGGDNVKGAHFTCANSNTMGIGMIGTFTSVIPASNAMFNLENILAWKCDQRGIDPQGSTYHNPTQLTLENISGHRDGNSTTAPGACPKGTACPGDQLYALLPSIRNEVQNLVQGTNHPCDWGDEVASSPYPLQMPFESGTTWQVGGVGYFYGDGTHSDNNNDYYAVDWNMVNGQDLGQPVYPVARGRVVAARGDCDCTSGCTGYGNYVEVIHSREAQPSYGVLKTRYAHLCEVSVAVGDHVDVDTQLGTVGSSGNSTGAHLHLSFQVYNGSRFVSLHDVAPSRRPGPMIAGSGSNLELWKLCDGQSRTVANKQFFTDVPNGFWGKPWIDAVYAWGVMKWYPQNEYWNFSPDVPVTRADVAVFWVRAHHGPDFTPPPATGTVFDDVPADHWAAAWIEQLHRDGFTAGCSISPPLYCPDRNLKRAEMAVFILRALHGSNYFPPPATGTVFNDAPVDYWGTKWIEQLATEGITTGCSLDPPLFCPENPVTRAEVAVFLLRSFGVYPPVLGGFGGFELSTTWQGNLIVTDAGEGTATLIFGQAPSATSGLDPAFGEVELPPVPPAGSFDARMELPISPAIGSLKDYRNDVDSTVTWKIKFQPGSAGYPVTVSWSASELPAAGRFTLKQEPAGNEIDMRQESSAQFSNNAPLSLVYTRQVCDRDGDINNDDQLTPADALCAFKIFLNGQSLVADCDAPEFDCEIVAANVNCDDTVTPGDALAIFQRFLNGMPPEECFAQSTLARVAGPKKPYQLSLSSHRVAKSTPATENDIVSLSLEVDNPEALSAFGLTLSYPVDKLDFIGVERTAVTVDWTQLEGQASRAGEIIIGGYTSEPLTATGSTQLFRALFAAKSQPIHSTDFEVSQLVDDFSGAVMKAVGSGAEGVTSTPQSFKLYQSYPNPFQSRMAAKGTVIRFDVPGREKVKVEISIYNLAGQLVRHLVSAIRAPGVHEIAWDGTDDRGRQVPAGIYLYRLKAGNVVESKRVVVFN